MKAIAFNGSPRKNRNTATLLHKALEGAAAQGAATEMVHLYDLDFKGCRSCFHCKRKGGPSYGKCASRDGLTPVLAKAEQADILILGCPIYLGAINGEMRSFLERLTFPFLAYDADHPTLFPRKLATAFIYTMGVTESRMQELRYDQVFGITEMFLKRTFGASETLIVNDTYQFDDYTKYVAPAFNEKAKAERRRNVFPEDCRKAFELGGRLVTQHP